MTELDIPAVAAFAYPLYNGRSTHPKRQKQAVERMLDDWQSIIRQRDKLIREALAVGISAREIQRRMGVARTTIARVNQK